MKKVLLAVFAIFLLSNAAHSQGGNSNIGTEFWTCWMDHIDSALSKNGGAVSQMNLYIASDIATTCTISATDNSFNSTINVAANTITIFAVPTSAYLGGLIGKQNKGIHIVSKNPVAVYAHIYASAVSGATLLLPVNTMANDYYSLNYTQLSNATPSYSVFDVIATADTTTVQITPTAQLIDGSKSGVPFTVTLNKGQVYQGIAATDKTGTRDLTGTRITSISTGTSGCKKIAVFSGSNKIYIGSPNQTSDNLFQQVYPTASWGKNYITVPLKDRNYDIIRIVTSDPTANITLNGSALPISKFTNSLYYDFNSQVTNFITSDKPIQVVQYAVTQGNLITGGKPSTTDVGDPEMIFLNPLEQNIDHVILYSANEYLILKSYINVVIPSAATSSFLLDGATQTGSFVKVPGNTAYSYAQFVVKSGATHTISASQGFNAIAYGFGNAESYGYAAGTNVKNLNEYVQYTNPTTQTIETSGCTGTSIIPEVIIPYQTTSITWDLGMGTTPVVQTTPILKNTFVKNGVTLYTYDYSSPVTYNPGSYAIKVTVIDPITTVCGSNEEIDLNFNVANPPTAKFASRDTTCLADTIGFTDQSTGNGSAITAWKWNFGNGDTSIIQNPVYKYLTPGDYTASLTVTISTGCQSTFTKNIHIRATSVAAFTNSTPDCETLGVTLTDQSKPGEGKITQWIWNYGDGTASETRTNGLPFTHTYATAGTDTVRLQILTDKGCSSSTISKVITIHPHPVVAFGLPDVCLANAVAQFTDKTTIADNSSAQFTYVWNFGDTTAAGASTNTSTLKNPTHQFTRAGVYPVMLTVTSKDTCTLSLSQNFTVSGQAKFIAPATSCPGDTVMFTDKTDGTNKVVSYWHWDFGTGDTSNVQNPKYPFKTPGDYNVVLTVSGHNGCSTTNFTQSIHINKKPTSNFTYSAPTCETKSITFTDASIANEGNIITWNWDFGDGGTSTLQNPVHTFKPFTTYAVKLTVTTDVGCNGTSTQMVIVNPQPVADFVLPDVCVSDGAAYFNAIPDKNGVSYTWNFGDAASNISASNPNTASGTSVSHHYITSGDYKATLTVVTAAGCMSDTVKTFHVNGSSPVAAFSVINPNGLCTSSPVAFQNQATIPGFGDQITGINMYYDYANHPHDSVHYERPASNAIFTHKYPLENTSQRAYTVRMLAYSGGTCGSAPYDVSITVLPVPALTFGTLPNLCQNSAKVDLTTFVTAGSIPGTGKFYIDGTTTAQSNIFDPAQVAIGTHTIYYIYTASAPGSCADTLNQPITVAPIPTVSAGSDVEVIAGSSVTLDGKTNATGSNVKILWTPTTGLSDPTILNPVATPKADTKYALTITLTTGGISCPVTDSVNVRLLHLPVIPNTFTPNGDGVNDTWEIKYLNQYPACTVKVFNRAGEMVYSSVGYSIPWDGRYQGNILPVGTYYYIVDPKHNLAVMSGSVNLIR